MALLMLLALILFGTMAGAIFYAYQVSQETHQLRHELAALAKRIEALENPPKGGRR